jgi:8-oxo-dGTP diphosphatase
MSPAFFSKKYFMEIWDILDNDGNKTGRTIERDKPMAEGDYHLVVHVWIRNSKNEYLISKRTPNKTFPNMWDTVGGSAILGESSLEAAIREVKEEIGLDLSKSDGKIIKRLTRSKRDSSDIVDIWFFEKDAEISGLVYQPDEVCDAKWASKKIILDMINAGRFVDVYTYLDIVFSHIA